MFQRRIFASAGVPRSMWGALHIQNTAQAQRMLPSFVALPRVGASGCGLPVNIAALALGLAEADVATASAGKSQLQVGELAALCAAILRQPMLNVTCLRDVIHCVLAERLMRREQLSSRII